MKLKLQQIVDAMPAISVFAQKELPAKAAYRVAKLVRKMTNEHRDYNQSREKLVKRLGEEVPEGKGWRVKQENLEAFGKELEGLLEAEVELEGCAKIAWADVDGLSLSPAVLADLEAFIEAPAA